MGVFDIILSALAALLRCCVPEEEKPQPPQVVVPPVPSVAYDNDTRFDPALLSVDAERLRQSAFAAGDEAAQKGRESHTRYESGDKHSAHELSLQAAECRATAAKAHAASADAVFAQKNAPRGLWEIDLHLLLVHEAEERVLRRLQSCAADPSAGRRELCIVYGQGCAFRSCSRCQH